MREHSSVWLRRMAEHHKFLINLALKFTHNPARAEDLVQDTYMLAIRFQERFDGKNLKAWLGTILTNKYYKQHRRYKLECAYLEELKGNHWDKEEKETKEQDVELEDTHFKETLSDPTLSALNALTKDHREAIMLNAFDDLTYKEISILTGASEGAITSRLARARDNFRKYYKFY